MALDPQQLTIVHHPAPILRTRAEPVGSIDDEIRAVANKMIELMIEAPGIGLAAPQVGIGIRMFVCHVPAHEADEPATEGIEAATETPMIAINPVLSEPSRDLVGYEEGCLSIPNITGEVRRPDRITLTATDENGKEFTLRGEGLLARCWQHEYDHLEGTLILDRMTAGSRLKNRRAIKELERGPRK